MSIYVTSFVFEIIGLDIFIFITGQPELLLNESLPMKALVLHGELVVVVVAAAAVVSAAAVVHQ